MHVSHLENSACFQTYVFNITVTITTFQSDDVCILHPCSAQQIIQLQSWYHVVSIDVSIWAFFLLKAIHAFAAQLNSLFGFCIYVYDLTLHIDI